MTEVRYSKPSYPDSMEWVNGSLAAIEAEMMPLISVLLEVVQ